MRTLRPATAGLARRLFGGDAERTLALLRAAWPRAVGPELARRTEVVALQGDALVVRVPDATWRRGLLKMRREILGRLRRVAGDLAPARMGFVEGKVIPPALPARPAEARVVEPAPPAPQVAEAAAAIEDPGLRDAFLSAAARYLSRFGD
jgi:hypothetical protein